MVIRAMFIICLFVSFLIPLTTYSAWQKPVEVIVGIWGQEETEFGIKRGDTSDRFPWLTAILSDGKIVISDGVNEREVVFNSDGTLFKVISWYIQSGTEKTVSSEYPLYKYWDVQGYTTEGNIWIKINNYLLKSPTGELLKTTTERPLELGKVKKRRLSGEEYKYTIQYHDRVYTIPTENIYEEGFIRDINSNLYGIGTVTDPKDVYVDAEWEGNTVSERAQPHFIVSRYSQCGILQARLDISADKSHFRKTDTGVIRDDSLLRQYGKPVVAPNGDVYTWKRTTDTYSILKWTWQDDPNPAADIPDAPVNLTISPSPTSINLTWKASLQDPGCVTGYEIGRSTVSDGTYSAIGTVPSGVFSYSDTSAEAGMTYYYKVRAVGGDGYSEYSNTESGQR